MLAASVAAWPARCLAAELIGIGRAGDGVAVNSSSQSEDISLDGLPQQEAQQRMLAWLQRTGRGQAQVNYKLRDWLFARQRYWGEPFPIIFPEGSQVSLRTSLFTVIAAHTAADSLKPSSAGFPTRVSWSSVLETGGAFASMPDVSMRSLCLLH